MSFDAFMESAWADHADHPDTVAVRLEQSLALVDSAAQIPAYARLVTHVFGEHLGQWQRGIALHDALRRAPAGEDSAGRAATRWNCRARQGGRDCRAAGSAR